MTLSTEKRVPRITVIGSLVFDLVARVDQRPKQGETRIGHDFGMFPGGKGANQAVQAARCRADVHMVGRVGDDFFGKELIQSLENCGVNISRVKTDKTTTTAVGCIIVDDSGDNSIVVVPQANMKCTKEDVDEALEVLQESDLLLLQLEIPLEVIDYAAKKACELDCRVILNPAPAALLPEDLLSCVDYLTPNESELEILTQKTLKTEKDIESAAKSLLEHGLKAVIVTLGEKGACQVTNQGVLYHPAFKVKAVDTTGAGDAFTGALAVQLAEGKRLEEAIQTSNAAGAAAVVKKGAQPSLACLEDIEFFLSEQSK